MPDIEAEPRVKLRHIIQRQFGWEEYYESRLLITRPDNGTAGQRVMCRFCEKNLTITVRSTSDTRSLRRTYGAQTKGAAVGILAILSVGMPLAFMASTAIPILLLIVLNTALVVVVFWRGLLWLGYSGVTMRTPEPIADYPRHELLQDPACRSA